MNIAIWAIAKAVRSENGQLIYRKGNNDLRLELYPIKTCLLMRDLLAARFLDDNDQSPENNESSRLLDR